MNIFSKRTIIIIAAFLLVLAAGTVVGLKIFSSQREDTPANQNSPFGVGSVDNLVTFTDAGFVPSTISISIERGLGCAVRLVNQTGKPLKIGISPHKEKDPGPDYPLIAPGDNFLFDPRFSGFTELRFHSHTDPMSELTVKFERTCQ